MGSIALGIFLVWSLDTDNSSTTPIKEEKSVLQITVNNNRPDGERQEYDLEIGPLSRTIVAFFSDGKWSSPSILVRLTDSCRMLSKFGNETLFKAGTLKIVNSSMLIKSFASIDASAVEFPEPP